MLDLTQEVRQKAQEAGFNSVGITAPENMQDLPYGWVADVRDLRPPGEILPGARSVIVLVFHAWDRAFFLQIKAPMWKGYGFHSPDEGIEGYYISSQVTTNKAWPVVSLLRERGHQAVVTTSIPLKASAIRSGLGCQGKSTLLVHPEYGPRLGLMAVLTTAELGVDEPFGEDLCGDCTRCIEACPTGALEPYKVNINRCMAYAAENPGKEDIPEDVRELERKLTVRPTQNSYIECTICMDACPIGREENRSE
jgi:epoxyqueuosine reductase